GRRPETKTATAEAEEQALEKRARELKKQAKQLEEQTERAGARPERSGLGPDLKPVPEPTVRDLSIPQAKSGRAKKPVEPVKEPAPADEGEVIPAREIAAATTSDILGKRGETDGQTAEKKEAKAETAAEEKNGAEKAPEPEINITGLPSAAP